MKKSNKTSKTNLTKSEKNEIRDSWNKSVPFFKLASDFCFIAAGTTLVVYLTLNHFNLLWVPIILVLLGIAALYVYKSNQR